MVLDIADVAFVLALGLGAGRATGPRAEAVVARQIDEARMELDVAATPVRGLPSALTDRPYWARWMRSWSATRLHPSGTSGTSSGSGASHSVGARFFGLRGARRSNASASARSDS